MPPDFVTVLTPKESHNVIHQSHEGPGLATSKSLPASTPVTEPSSHSVDKDCTPLSSVLSRVSQESNNSGYYGILDDYTGECSAELDEGDEVTSSPTDNLQIADLTTYGATTPDNISSKVDKCQYIGNGTTLDERAASAAQERYLKGPDSGRSSRTVVGSVGSSTDNEKFSSDYTVSDVHHNETLQSGINHAATVFRRSYKEKVDQTIKQGLRDKKRRRRHVLSLVRQLRASTIRIKLLGEGKHAAKERAIEQENRLQAELSQISGDLKDTKNDLHTSVVEANRARSESESKDDTIGKLTSQYAVLFEELAQTKSEKEKLEDVNSYLQSDLERYIATEGARAGDNDESEISGLKLRIKTLMQANKDGERHQTALLAENRRIWEAHEGDREGKLNHDPEINALKASLEEVKQENLEVHKYHEEYARNKDVELTELRLDNARMQQELDLGKKHIETLYELAPTKKTLDLPKGTQKTRQSTTLEQQMEDIFVETVNDNAQLIAALKDAKLETGIRLYLLNEEQKKVVCIEAGLQATTKERDELKASLSKVTDELLGCRIERYEILPKEHERQTTKKRIELSNLKYTINQLKIENACFNPATPPGERAAAVQRFHHSVSKLLEEIEQLRKERDHLKNFTQQQELEIDEAREAEFTQQETYAIDMSRLQHEVTCLREITNGEISSDIQAIHYRLQHERRTREEAEENCREAQENFREAEVSCRVTEEKLEDMAQRYEALLQRITGAGVIPTREPDVQDQDAGLRETSFGFDYADESQSKSGEDSAEGSIAESTEQSQPAGSDSNEEVEEDSIEPNAPSDRSKTSSEPADPWDGDMPRLLDEDPALPILSDLPAANDVSSSKETTETAHHPLHELLERSTEDTNEPLDEPHHPGHGPHDNVHEPIRGNTLLQDLLQDSIPDELPAQYLAPREQLYANTQIRVQPQITPWPQPSIWSSNNIPAQQTLEPTHQVPRSRFAGI